MSRQEIRTKLDDILFENEQALAIVECVQELISNEVAEVVGVPEHTLEYALFKAVSMLRSNNEIIANLLKQSRP